MSGRRKGKTQKPATRTPRRRRAVPLWRTRSAFAAAALAGLALIGAGGWWLWSTGHVARWVERTMIAAIGATADMGFAVGEVLVTGRRETARADLLAAVGLERGDPILAFDPAAAKRRVEALPWVRTASVERLLPDRVVVRVVERRPMALWQHQGRFAVIDFEGGVILRDRVQRFAGLPVVVGEDAPDHAADLLEILATQPQLMERVEAAVRVGGRRWNLRLKGGVDVRLPEADPAAAWTMLGEYQRSHGVLERDVRVLDLRLPDRLIVRPPRRPAVKTTKGQQT